MPNNRCCPNDWILLIVVLLICGLWLLDPSVLPARPAAIAPPTEVTRAVAAPAELPRTAVRPDGIRTQGSEPTARPARKMRAVPPVGWRRTTRGWERMPVTPPPPPSINELIDRQVQTESRWTIYAMLERVRRWHPLSLAAAQLGIAGLLALTARPQSAPRGGVVATPARSTPAPAVSHTS